MRIREEGKIEKADLERKGSHECNSQRERLGVIKAQKICINTKNYFYLTQLTSETIIIFTIAQVNNLMPSIHQTINFIHHFLSSCFRNLRA